MIIKKLLALGLSSLLLLSMAGCSLMPAASGASGSSEQETVSQPEETDVPEESGSTPEEEPGEDVEDPDHPDNVDTESGELPAVTGEEAFVGAFTKNDIDKAYLEEIEKAESIADMITVTNKATTAWETQLNYGFSQLSDTLTGEELDQVTLEQSAWSNELTLAIDEIKAGAEGAGSTGTLDVAYKVMLLYRSRAIVVFDHLYQTTGEVNFSESTGEAVG